MEPHQPTFAPPAAATFHAWWTAFLLFLSITVNFMDRLVLGSVAPTLQATLHFSSTEYSYIVSAFTLGMTLGQLPSGAFIDRMGFRNAMPCLLAGWSLTNGLQALARTVTAFSGLRFLMGTFECGNYSAGVKAVGELFPARQSAFALGIFNSGSILGSVIAPALVVSITLRFGWRAAFLLPSLAGMLWLLPWFASCPRGSTSSHDGPPNGISLQNLLRPRQAWGVVIMRAFTGPLTTFYWFWLPLYLVRGRGMTLSSMAGMASLAYLLGGVGQAGGGYFSGWLVGRGRSVDAARKFTCTLGGVIAASGTFLVPMTGGVRLAGIMAGMGILGANVMSNMQIAVITDVFPPSVQARVTSLTGFGEGLVNMGMSVATGFLVDRFSFVPVFMSAAFLPAAALAGLFFFVRNCRRLSPLEIVQATS